MGRDSANPALATTLSEPLAFLAERLAAGSADFVPGLDVLSVFAVVMVVMNVPMSWRVILRGCGMIWGNFHVTIPNKVTMRRRQTLHATVGITCRLLSPILERGDSVDRMCGPERSTFAAFCRSQDFLAGT